jgi:hypothetical protein
MKQLRTLLLLTLAVGLFSCSTSVDDIITKNMEARGGSNAKAIKNYIYEGTANSMGFNMPFKLFLMPPDKIRYEIEAMGSKIITIGNGSKAWQIDSTIHEVPNFSAETIKQTIDMQFKTFESDLINYKAKGSKVELLGEDTVAGKKTYKIKVILKDSSETVYFIDKDSYLEVKSISKSNIMGQKIEQFIYFSDYKKVGEYNIPHKWVFKMKNEKGVEDVYQELVYKNIKIDQKFEENLFTPPQMPAVTEEIK